MARACLFEGQGPDLVAVAWLGTLAAMNRRPPPRDRAFTIVPLAVALWAALILLGVLLWKRVPPPGYVPGKSVGPGQFASVILALLYGGFWVFVLGGVSEKKGRKFANVCAVITLGFAAFMLGLSYAGLTADQRNLGRAGAVGAGGSGLSAGPSGAGPSGGGASPNSTAPGLPRMADQLRRQDERAQQPRPAPPVQPDATPQVPTRNQAMPTPVPPVNAPPAAPALPSEDPRVVQVKDDLLKSINADAAAVLAKFDALCEVAPKSFKRDMREMDRRKADAGELKVAAGTFEKRLKGVGEEVSEQLRRAGVPESDLTGASIRTEMALHAGSRAMGCGTVSRFADLVAEHADLWRSKFDKWSIDGKGQVKWKDPALQGQARSLQFRIEADIKSNDMTRRWLKGE